MNGSLPMFVYGTLRRGGHLELAYFSDDVARLPAILPGHALHYARRHHAFPYAVPCVGPEREQLSSIVGELVFADEADIRNALRMEINAGYIARRVEVLVEAEGRAGRSMTVAAVAAIWPDRKVGARIASGDWMNR